MQASEALRLIGGLPGLLILALAIYRLSRLLAIEEGPARMFVRYRQAGINLGLGALVTCFYCTSVWVSIVLPLVWLSGLPGQVFVLWLAVAGAACFMFALEPGE